jgi:DNA-binding MarR family transcriptional regulator
MESTPDERLALALERLGEVARALRWRQATEAGLSALQLRILGFIAAHPGRDVGVAALAEELQLGRPTVSESVKALVDHGYLDRKADARDGRSHALRLRAAGRRHVRGAAPLTDAVRTLPAARKEEMLLAVMQVLDHMVDSGAVQVQRMCWTCRHYRGDRARKNYCALLEKDLPVPELRTDCEEHERVA